MNEFLNKNKIRLVVLAIAVVVLFASVSYAYFTASVSNQGTVYDNVITTGNMELLFRDGQVVGTPTNMIPGQSITKTFKVKNVGTVDTVYDVYLSEIINNFVDLNDLQYKIEGRCASDNQYHVMPSYSSDSSKIISGCGISPNIEDEYTLTILFSEDESNQDDNKGASFSARIAINEYASAERTITLHIDKDTSYTITRTLGSEVGSIASPESEGFTFSGWYKDNNRTIALNSSDIVTLDLNDIYAKFSANQNVDFVKYLRYLRRNDVVQDDLSGYENMRFVGETPNNYINLTLGNGNTELFRIIGVFGVDTHRNDSAESIKIVKAEPLERQAYSTDWTVGYYGKASLKTSLNSTSTYKYANSSYVKSVNWANGGIQSYILTDMYRDERTEYWLSSEFIWNGVVAIPYLSDFLYATNGGGTTSRSECLSVDFKTSDLWKLGGNVGDCMASSWLVNYRDLRYKYQNDSSLYGENRASYSTFSRGSATNYICYINYQYTYYINGGNALAYVLPSMYLADNLKCSNCHMQDAGTISNPYTVSLPS